MTLDQAEAALETALVLTQKLAPLASVFGPAGAAAGATIASIAQLGATVLAEVSSDATIIASGDLTRIRALQASLQTENAALAQEIAAS